MMLPILISVSVAPGSYFFCALAALVTATARSPAIAIDLAWLKTRVCIIVLPDVLADGSGSLLTGSLDRAVGLNARSVCTIAVPLPAKPWLLFSVQRKKQGASGFLCAGANGSAIADP